MKNRCSAGALAREPTPESFPLFYSYPDDGTHQTRQAQPCPEGIEKPEMHRKKREGHEFTRANYAAKIKRFSA